MGVNRCNGPGKQACLVSAASNLCARNQVYEERGVGGHGVREVERANCQDCKASVRDLTFPLRRETREDSCRGMTLLSKDHRLGLKKDHFFLVCFK